MSKRKTKFNITFNRSEETLARTTPIQLNGDSVGHICHPGFDSHAPGKYHIVIFQRVIDHPSPKCLKPLFPTEFSAKQYVEDNLQELHEARPLYLANPPKEKQPRVKSGEDWLAADWGV